MNRPNVAILDLYQGHPNEGMRCIKSLVSTFFKSPEPFQVFDVRGKGEVPKVEDFSIVISTGGPGSPLFTGEAWEQAYCQYLQAVWEHNQKQDTKVYVFLICHSFQLAVQHWQLGEVCRRKSTSFGVMPIHMTEAGREEPLFQNLEDPFWAVDSRDFQVIQPDDTAFRKLGAHLLCLEKERPHVPLERAIMAIRFSPEIIGTQFHPEADAEGMRRYFLQEEKRQAVILEHGQEKYEDMIDHLEDPDKIFHTEQTILPQFLAFATQNILLDGNQR
ncbi:MAG: type 1 glutamine amidotransferase [Spirosomataceae bacterium]